ncbi:hypothetical protein LTS18_004414 [Coniosporium uncinatum]|uniref:Uncharacterized protein n=1 Tax=Coniosporium uncinatum TaxID=93489 RepID=A0ACC3DSI6_9PEZI|nr:hypothetical protein LTS18_004414 [Coniosporium uncinatum]
MGTWANTTEPTPAAPPRYTFTELWDLHKAFWDAFIYPNNLAEAAKVNSSIFASNALGRVDVTRTFDGAELNTEYVFGLFANLGETDGFSLLGTPKTYTITKFAANENLVSSSVIIQFDFRVFNRSVPVQIDFRVFNRSVPVQIDTWVTFDSNKQIAQYDSTFHLLDWLFAQLYMVAQKQFKTPNATVTQQVLATDLAFSICKTHDTYCTGASHNYTQYGNTKSCMDFLTKDVRFGQTWEMGMNTLLCRMVHENMVRYRPEVHCSHIGPSGGGMCVDDMTYQDKLLEPYFKVDSFLPYNHVSQQWWTGGPAA